MGTPVPEPPKIPLPELTVDLYLNQFEGGLYPDQLNVMPTRHRIAGVQRGEAVQPLNSGGGPDPNGRYVLLSIGGSNATQEFCSASSVAPCDPWTFMGLASADPDVNTPQLEIVNGAAQDQEALTWEAATHPNYDRIRNDHLAPRGLSENQVQVIWLKVANARSLATLPDEISDAHNLLARLGIIARALLVRYPNLKQVFVSSRIYGGFSTGPLNGEPYAYETGFAVKWLIESQIIKVDDPLFRNDFTGDLDYNTVAPWLAWGPYLWADGENPSGTGIDWTEQDFEADGVQPSQTGEEKVGMLLLDFFKTSGYTACWFTKTGVCG